MAKIEKTKSYLDYKGENEKMQINIELTDREIELLKQYNEVYEEERKIDCTADPIVLVQDRIKIYTKSDYGYDGTEYGLIVNGFNVTEDSLIESTKELEDKIREELEYEDKGKVDEIIDDMKDEILGFYASDEFIYDENGIKVEVTCHYFNYEWETKAYFFTRKEAERYVEYQGHNLSYPRVFTDYAGYSNDGDFPVFQKLLLRIGEKLINE